MPALQPEVLAVGSLLHFLFLNKCLLNAAMTAMTQLWGSCGNVWLPPKSSLTS